MLVAQSLGYCSEWYISEPVILLFIFIVLCFFNHNVKFKESKRSLFLMFRSNQLELNLLLFLIMSNRNLQSCYMIECSMITTTIIFFCRCRTQIDHSPYIWFLSMHLLYPFPFFLNANNFLYIILYI